MSLPNWTQKLTNAIAARAGGDAAQREFLEANGGAIGRALAGVPGPGAGRLGVGGCIVVNIASVHVPAFTRPNGRYKNCYDLDKEAKRIGKAPGTSAKRIAVDKALAELHGHPPEAIYFTALELNGCGIGFYGDFCLVLADDITDKDMVVLDRNSYDLIREPLHGRIARRAQQDGSSEAAKRTEAARAIAGRLKDHAAEIAAIKVLEARPPTQRLVTTGAVSDGVLDDEDYIEVLRPQTFTAADVREVRLSPADVALDERIRGRSLSGRPPSQAELLWRSRRRAAEDRLRAHGVPVRVVTTAGRTKG